VEADRLIELMSGDGGGELRYTTTTPAKAKMTRWVKPQPSES
jgi:hypothetical protein